MIYFSIIILSVAQIALAISFMRFRRSVETLFLKLSTNDERQNIDIDTLTSRISELFHFIHSHCMFSN